MKLSCAHTDFIVIKPDTQTPVLQKDDILVTEGSYMQEFPFIVKSPSKNHLKDE